MLCGSVDSDSFMNSLFNNKKCVICEADIEFCYLNQIAGPRLKEWKDKCPLYIGGNGIGYTEMRTLPVQWTNKYIDSCTSTLDTISVPQSKWVEGHGLKPAPHRRQHKNSTNIFHKLKLQRHQKCLTQPSDVFICKPRVELTIGDPYDAGYVLEYITSESSTVVLLVELTQAQSIYVGTVVKDYVDLRPLSQYNAMLDCFLKWSGR